VSEVTRDLHLLSTNLTSKLISDKGPSSTKEPRDRVTATAEGLIFMGLVNLFRHVVRNCCVSHLYGLMLVGRLADGAVIQFQNRAGIRGLFESLDVAQ